MTKTILMDKYPIFSLEINKSETTFCSVDEIIEHLKGLVDNHPVAKFIAIFDHYAHTLSMDDGVVSEEIKDAKNLIFCFGKQLPSTKILAVRPRSIGVSELENSFVIDFLEVPNEQLHIVTEDWAKSIANK
jgi:hypothetical protein